MPGKEWRNAIRMLGIRKYEKEPLRAENLITKMKNTL